MIRKIDHTGLLADDLGSTIARLEKIGFEKEAEFNLTKPKARGALLACGGNQIELFEFENQDDEWVEYIRNHVAFASNDIKNDITLLEGQGYNLTIPLQEFSEVSYAFLRDESGNNVELIERKS